MANFLKIRLKVGKEVSIPLHLIGNHLLKRLAVSGVNTLTLSDMDQIVLVCWTTIQQFPLDPFLQIELHVLLKTFDLSGNLILTLEGFLCV